MRLPNQSIRAPPRAAVSCSEWYAHTVPTTPIGTLTQKIARQEISESTPPRTRPMNDPAIAAIWLIPSAVPRRSGGKASVRIAVELANSIDPPTACTRRHPMIHRAAPRPWPGVSASATDAAENTTKPRL